MEAKGSQRQGCYSNVRLKEAGGKSVGRYAFAVSYVGTSVQVWPGDKEVIGVGRSGGVGQDESATHDKVFYPS